MSEEQCQKHLDHVRQYVEEEVTWGRENLKEEALKNFIDHTVEHYLPEVEKLLAGEPKRG